MLRKKSIHNNGKKEEKADDIIYTMGATKTSTQQLAPQSHDIIMAAL